MNKTYTITSWGSLEAKLLPMSDSDHREQLPVLVARGKAKEDDQARPNSMPSQEAV